MTLRQQRTTLHYNKHDHDTQQRQLKLVDDSEAKPPRYSNINHLFTGVYHSNSGNMKKTTDTTNSLTFTFLK